MSWLNENVGVVVLVFAIVTILLLAVCLFLMFNLRSKIAVQRLKFLGFYSADMDSRKNYAEVIIGNKSLNDVGIAELGIRNGKMSFDLTDLYKKKTGMSADTRIVIEQRSAINFRLSVRELKKILMDGKDGRKILKTLKIYAVDITGTLYKGRTAAIKKLLHDVMLAERNGEDFVPVPEKEPTVVRVEADEEPAAEKPEAAAPQADKADKAKDNAPA